MTCRQILTELEKMGTETTKNTFLKHGAKEPLYGVKVEDLKKIQKKVKKDYALSLELYNSGISDACYLAGLIADETRMTRQDLQHWAHNASWYMISEYTVPWVASESAHGYELALEWIDSETDSISAAGWSTLASLVTIKQDHELNLTSLHQLLNRVVASIHQAPNRTRYAMNSFVIALGCAVKDLTPEAVQAGNQIGMVKVDMGGTACKVPFAPDYIQKAIDKGKLGHKKKRARC